MMFALASPVKFPDQRFHKRELQLNAQLYCRHLF